MKKYLSILLIFIGFLSSVAIAGNNQVAFNRIIFFGDSLSDNGNLYSYTRGYIPKSTPYFDGRFSNGYTWAEYVAKKQYDTNLIPYKNYAIGGEVAVAHLSKEKAPYSLTFSVSQYLTSNYFYSKEKDFAIVWIGANDYLHGCEPDKIDAVTTEVVENIKANINKLINGNRGGSKNILVINLPDLAYTPYGKTEKKLESILSNLTNAHNKKLLTAVEQLKIEHPDVNIHLYDLNNLFVNFIQNPSAYNEKYKTNVTNVSESCWTGGYTLYRNKNKANEEQKILNQLNAYMANDEVKNKLMTNASPLKTDNAELAHAIITSPALYETYRVGEGAKTGEVRRCTNTENYLFWDTIHPSAVMHFILSQEIGQFIADHFTAQKDPIVQ